MNLSPRRFADVVVVSPVGRIDQSSADTFKDVLAPHLARCTAGEWENAILKGYAVWREVSRRGAGIITVDLDARSLTYREV